VFCQCNNNKNCNHVLITYTLFYNNNKTNTVYRYSVFSSHLVLVIFDLIIMALHTPVNLIYIKPHLHRYVWLCAGIPSWYVIRHLGQLNLLPSVGWKISTTTKGSRSALWLQKITIGLASHWPCHKLCDISLCRIDGLNREKHFAYTHLWATVLWWTKKRQNQANDPTVRVSALCSFKWLDTGWMAGWTSGSQKSPFH